MAITSKNTKFPKIIVIITNESLFVYLFYCIFLTKIIYIIHIILIINLLFDLFYRIIKMSSPDINNIILMGCIILYSYVFIDGLDTKEMPVVCKVCLNLFSLKNLKLFMNSRTRNKLTVFDSHVKNKTKTNTFF